MAFCRPAHLIPHSRPLTDEADVRRVSEALRAGRLSEGEYVAELERKLSAMFDGREVVAVGSGTAALALALAALDACEGGAVVIPAYVCRSVYAAVAYAGAEPVCADAGPDSVCVCAGTVKAVLPGNARAVIVPHMFGFEADVEGIRALGVPVVEDCAQALGGRTTSGRLPGLAGDVSVFSFYATKLLPSGEGGACVTADGRLAGMIRNLRHCDETPLCKKAFNFKMSDIHAALALSQLEKLPANLARRDKLAAGYDRVFKEFSWRRRERQAVCFRYLVETSPGKIDFVLRAAEELGIACRKPVIEPLHRALGGCCPAADERHERLVSVPCYPGLDEQEIGWISEELPALLLRCAARGA